MRARPGLLLVFLAFFVCCGQEDRGLNVLIIGVDTLRPDHLGCYGYHRDTSPAIDQLASEGVLFGNAISQSPWTLPSFATVFTSLYPSQHGAMSAVSKMRESFPTLGTILSEGGYVTGAIVNATVLRPGYGVDRGFDFYDPTPPEGRIGDGTTRDALEWMDLHRDEPFLLFVHYFDPHEPYAPPPPYDTRFTGNYTGMIGNSFVLHDYLPGVLGNQFEDLKTLNDADWNQIRALYDGEIAFTDKAIDGLLMGLQDRDLEHNTLIIFLADHGEEFYDHEGFGHGHSLFDEAIHVPLIFSLPGRIAEQKRVSQQVRLVDVLPTILDLLGINSDEHLEGTSLLPLLAGSGELQAPAGCLFPPEVAYSEGLLHGPERKSVNIYPWKLIYDFSTRDEVLFNLEEDPFETQDVALYEPDALEPLRDMLVKGLLRASGTWYIEMAGFGHDHAFDVDISAESGQGIGRVVLAALIDESGRIADPGAVRAEGHSLSIEGLRPDGPVTLAFQVDAPPRLPIGFTFSIDGEETSESTYIGGDMDKPKTMPFSLEVRGSGAHSKTRPRPRPSPPYFLVWHTRPQYSGRTAIQLDETTKRELRALGYIQ